MVKHRTITTNVTQISWEQDFLRIRFLATENVFDLEEAKRQYVAAKELTKGMKYRVLIDVRDVHVLPEKEAQEFLSQIEEKLAEAIIVNTIAARIISKYYIRKTKNNPVKVFTKESKAINWLMKH